MSKRSWIILRFTVAIGIIVFLLTKISISDVLNSIISAKIHYFILATALSLIAWYVGAYRLKMFCDFQGLSISTPRAFEITLSALFYGLFLPGGNLTTGLIKFYKLSWKDKKLSEGFIALALDRVYATAATCLAGIFFWIISIPEGSEEFVISMVVALLGLFVFSYILFFDRDHKVINGALRTVNKIYYSEKLNNFIQGLSGLGSIPLSTHIYMGAVSTAVQIINILAFYLLLHSLSLNITFATIGWISSVVLLVTIIPITISGLGLREASFILLLGSFGVSESSAFAYSLLVFAVTRIMPGLLGGLIEVKALIMYGRNP